ncbi:MAG: hypothetical protein LIO80_05290 [Lachnospiraceae bacterium]|nr:hypothetical protein [Lachnospiraceae bacterium]
MFISFNILLNKLLFSHPEYNCIRGKSVPESRIQGIRMLSSDEHGMDPDCLYICDASNDPNEPILINASNILYISKDPVPAYGKEIVLYTDINSSFILNELWKIYNHLRDWERDLDMEIIQNGNLQTLIDLSEDIIGCPVILYDGAQKVLASTRHLYPQSPKDTFFKNVVEKGYLFSHAMDTFIEGGTFSKVYEDGYSVEDDVFQQELKNIYMLLSTKTSTIGHLTAMCIRREDVSWTKELLLLLESKVIHCFELHRQSDLIRHQIFDYLFAELVENTSLTEADIQDKIIHLNISDEKSFQLLCLDFSSNRKIPMEILTHEMSSLMGTNHITIYRDHIFILLSSDKTDVDEDYFAGLQSLLDYMGSDPGKKV